MMLQHFIFSTLLQSGVKVGAFFQPPEKGKRVGLPCPVNEGFFCGRSIWLTHLKHPF
jgi:hypothetical protein